MAAEKRSTSKKKVTFELACEELDRFAEEIRARFPGVEAEVWTPHPSTCSLGVRPRHHTQSRVEVLGFVDLGDDGIAIGGVRARTLGTLQGYLARHWTVGSFVSMLMDMQEAASEPTEGRVFRGHTGALGEPLPLAVEITAADVAHLDATHVGEELASIEITLARTVDSSQVAATLLPGDRAIFAGHWIKVVDASLVEPGRWKVTCTKTLDPRVRAAA